jgi:DMSO/TMAO reductase YedYZ molybdopterin-dependent catalytic subunit
MKRRNIFILLMSLFLVSILLSACSGIPNVDWTLTISGDVSNPVSFTFKDLAEMDHVTLEEVLMEKSRGEDEIRTFSGVKLQTLLDMAGTPNDFSSVTASAADGYAIVISAEELTDSIIALKDGEDWIIKTRPNDGAMRLVTPMTPANRWVFQLTEISINP